MSEKEIWSAINQLKEQYAKLCLRLGTLEGKINIIITITSTTFIAIITTIITLVLRGG